ncbi:hypothetical protein GCK72_018557 [Caenorhabditis remanei]|uniref:Serpentine receptor class gamma n=1 Tax=Caenorhabditis remanei TaxID=31234 RepID=A0A6A5GBF2_CAERE|nr:hypothetical protein GCK72_018557 [Caenorhabditis remanei]KAF1752003.1 hypothetical protein GCK72_018557 [Caenorhabditis remanei]
MENHTAIRLIRDFICNWSYHIQSSSLLLKCVFRFTLAKYPNGPEIWKHYFRLILILTLLYSCLATIPYCVVSIDDPGKNVYSIFMNIETSIYFVLTISIGYFTQRELKCRSSQIMASIKKMNRYLLFDLSIHFIVFLGVLLPAFVLPSLEKFMKTHIMMSLVDLVALTPSYILIICDNNIRNLIRCKKKTVIQVLPSDINSTFK